MAKVSLQRPGIVPLVGQGKAARVPQHVGMGLERQTGLDANTLRYDRNANNFLAAVCIAATVSYWL